MVLLTVFQGGGEGAQGWVKGGSAGVFLAHPECRLVCSSSPSRVCILLSVDLVSTTRSGFLKLKETMSTPSLGEHQNIFI